MDVLKLIKIFNVLKIFYVIHTFWIFNICKIRSLEGKALLLLFTHDIGDDDGGGEEDKKGEERDHDDDAGRLVTGLHRAQRQQLVTHLHSVRM